MCQNIVLGGTCKDRFGNLGLSPTLLGFIYCDECKDSSNKPKSTVTEPFRLYNYKSILAPDEKKEEKPFLTPLNLHVNTSKELDLFKSGYLDKKELSSPVKDYVSSRGIEPLRSSISTPFYSGPVPRRATLGGWG